MDYSDNPDKKKRAVLFLLGFLIFSACPFILESVELDYYLDVISRIFIYGLFATSLDLLMGYGKLASMGHALFFGIGAYAVGIVSFHWGEAIHFQYILMLLAGLTVSFLVACFIGFICLATDGVFFIMLTLAFGQLVFFLFNSLRIYGGEDGLIIDEIPLLPFYGEIDSRLIYYISIVFWFAGYLSCKWLLSTPYGLAYTAAANNDQKARSLGFVTKNYRLIGYIISALWATVAGSILALLNMFVSPTLMHWTKSAEVLIMVVLGGIKTLVGGLLGATIIILSEEFLAPLFESWHILLGLLLVTVVMLRKGGVYHLIRRLPLFRKKKS